MQASYSWSEVVAGTLTPEGSPNYPRASLPRSISPHAAPLFPSLMKGAGGRESARKSFPNSATRSAPINIPSP